VFTGFSQETIDFMWNLRLNNNKEWFESHKEDFKTYLQIPMKELGQEVYKQINNKYEACGLIYKLSRIHRDARRVRNGRPYKDCFWFALERPSKEEHAGVLTFWFELTPDNWNYGLGYYAAKAATMAKLRAKIDKDPKIFEKLISSLEKQEEFQLVGEEYARKKQAPTLKTQEWYNKKSFSIIHSEEFCEELFQGEFLERIVKGFDFLMPFYNYFVDCDYDV